METLNQEGMIFIEVELPTCLYERASVKFLNRLQDAIIRSENSQTLLAVIVCFKQPMHDLTISWINELETELLADDLSQRILDVRRLLKRIQSSPIPWISVAFGSILGTMCELAFACHWRIWIGEGAVVGFPELEVDIVPVGGVALGFPEFLAEEREKVQVIHPISQMEADGFCEVWGSDSAWAEHVESYCRQNFQALKRLCKPLSYEFDRERQGAIVDLQNDPAAVDVLNDYTIPKSHRKKNRWSLAWHLISSKHRFLQERNFEVVWSLMAARNFLAVDYLNLLRNSTQLRIAPGHWEDRPRQVGIDITHRLPPTRLLLGMLESNIEVVFHQEGYQELASRLDKVFHRLEKKVGSEKARRLWRNQVGWFQGTEDMLFPITLRWLNQEQIELLNGEKLEQVRKFKRREVYHDVGVAEYISASEHVPYWGKSLRGLVWNELVVCRPSAPDSISCSQIIRFLFLSEILRVSTNCDGGLVFVISALEQSGWGFAGQSEKWDEFLVHLSFSQVIKELNRLGLDLNAEINIEDCQSWRQLKARIGKQQKDSQKWSVTAVHRHFLFFLGLLNQRLYPLLHKASDMDLLSVYALGVPARCPWPEAAWQELSPIRTMWYVNQHWSWKELSKGTIIEAAN